MNRPKALSEEHLKVLRDKARNTPHNMADVYEYIGTLELQMGYIETLEAQVSTLLAALQRCQELVKELRL